MEPDDGAAGWPGNFAFISYQTDVDLVHVSAQFCVAFPSNGGINGGFPGSASRHLIRRNSNVRELIAMGRMPQRLEDVSGKIELLNAKCQTTQAQEDFYEITFFGGAGFGDPLDRPPELVKADVTKGLVSREAAFGLYGVVLDTRSNGVDAAASEARRREIRCQRLGGTAPPDGVPRRWDSRIMDEEAAISEYLRCEGDRVACPQMRSRYRSQEREPQAVPGQPGAAGHRAVALQSRSLPLCGCRDSLSQLPLPRAVPPRSRWRLPTRHCRRCGTVSSTRKAAKKRIRRRPTVAGSWSISWFRAMKRTSSVRASRSGCERITCAGLVEPQCGRGDRFFHPREFNPGAVCLERLLPLQVACGHRLTLENSWPLAHIREIARSGGLLRAAAARRRKCSLATLPPVHGPRNNLGFKLTGGGGDER